MALPWSRESDVLALVSRMPDYDNDGVPDGFVPTYVRWAMDQTDAPALYQVLTALSLVSSVVPPHLCIGGLPDGDMHANLYVMIVGRQGVDRKSTAIKYATKLLHQAVEGRRAIPPRSEQGLADGLADQPQQLLVYEDFGTFFANTQRRSGGNVFTAIKARLLPLYDCDADAASGRRAGNRITRCDNPRLSLIGGVNRPILDTYVDPEDWNTGFTSRFIVAYAHRERTKYHRKKLPHVRQWLKKWLEGMAALANTESAWGECIGLSPEAHRLLRAFTHAIEVTTPHMGVNARSVGPRARVRNHALKIAFNLGLSAGLGWPDPAQPGSRGADWKIDGPLMKVSIQLALTCFTGALAITASATSSLDMRQRQQVLDAIGSSWTPHSQVLVEGQVLQRKATSILDTLRKEGTIEHRLVGGEWAEYRRTGQNIHDRGVNVARDALAEIIEEYHFAYTNGVSVERGSQDNFYLPPLPSGINGANGAGAIERPDNSNFGPRADLDLGTHNGGTVRDKDGFTFDL